jgi:hypothetical protein
MRVTGYATAMWHARRFCKGERTQRSDDRAQRPVPRSRQPVHLVTLTPEDLPEAHRSSCDGLVLGLAETPRSCRGAGHPDGL